MGFIRSLLIACVFILSSQLLYADEFNFVNGDRLSGEIVKVTEKKVTINTDLVGVVTFDRHQINMIEGEEAALYILTYYVVEEDLPEEVPAVKWERSVSASFAQSGGNTEKKSF